MGRCTRGDLVIQRKRKLWMLHDQIGWHLLNVGPIVVKHDTVGRMQKLVFALYELA